MAKLPRVTSSVPGTERHLFPDRHRQNQQSYISPAVPSNSSWIGNQTPAVTAQLVGPIDFPNIAANGFDDVNGNNYVNFGNNNNSVEARWYGDITIPGTGSTPVPISFQTGSDDGSMIYIDGNAVVNNNFYQPVVYRSGTVNLTPGLHAIDIEYYNGGGGAGMFAQWDTTGTNGGGGWSDIPNSAFSIVTPQNGVTMSGTGSLTLSHTNNTYVGPTAIQAGKLIVTANGAMGPATAAGITVSSGASLGLAGGVDYTTAESLHIVGSGFAGDGAIQSASNNINTLGIPFQALNGPEVVGASAGTLSIPGSIPLGNGTLLMAGPGNTTISGTVTSDGGKIGGDGTGTETVSGNVTCSGSGLTLVSTTALTISGNVDLGTTGNLTAASSGTDTITGVISGDGTSVQGLTGTYFQIGNGSGQQSYISPASPNNSTWIGNQTPAATALLTGAVDFPDISDNGFEDNNGNTYVNFGNNNNSVEARWYGQIDVPNNGVTGNPISFQTGSDDGSMLYIDGNAVVSNNFYQGVTYRSATVNLTPGLHIIDIEYYNGGGGAGMFAQWDPTGGGSFTDIPNSVFSTLSNSVTKSGTGTLICEHQHLLWAHDSRRRRTWRFWNGLHCSGQCHHQSWRQPRRQPPHPHAEYRQSFARGRRRLFRQHKFSDQL